MPELFDRSDIEMTLYVLENLSEVIETEIERRKIDYKTAAFEAKIPNHSMDEIIYYGGKICSLKLITDVLNWLTVSTNL